MKGFSGLTVKPRDRGVKDRERSAWASTDCSEGVSCPGTVPSSRWLRRGRHVGATTGRADYVVVQSSVSSANNSQRQLVLVLDDAVLVTVSTTDRLTGTLSAFVDVTASGLSSVAISSLVSVIHVPLPASSSSKLSLARSLCLQLYDYMSLSVRPSVCPCRTWRKWVPLVDDHATPRPHVRATRRRRRWSAVSCGWPECSESSVQSGVHVNLHVIVGLSALQHRTKQQVSVVFTLLHSYDTWYVIKRQLTSICTTVSKVIAIQHLISPTRRRNTSFHDSEKTIKQQQLSASSLTVTGHENATDKTMPANRRVRSGQCCQHRRVVRQSVGSVVLPVCMVLMCRVLLAHRHRHRAAM